jgi:hypothetical protein
MEITRKHVAMGVAERLKYIILFAITFAVLGFLIPHLIDGIMR